MKTIIVDDEPIMLKGFARLSRDVEEIELVGQFGDGESALEFMEHNDVDLACLDITMPLMDGLELSDIIREKYPDAMIVFVTAHDEHASEAMGAEGDYYVLKPYTRGVLEEMVSAVAQKKCS